jgi:putative acetyltransferase
MRQRRINVVDTALSDESAIGQWLWALQDARQRTLEELMSLTDAVCDWMPPDDDSSIGTILYHLAAIEADWLYVEVLEQPFPPDVEGLFPHPVRDAAGRLTQVQGVSPEAHIQRLEIVRGLLLGVFQHMDLSEFRRVRALPDYDVTPEWVLHHLMQHEAEHRSQIGAVRAKAERHLSAREPLTTIRSERPDDRTAIHAVNAAAFGRASEADLVDALRVNGHLTLSLVAVRDDEVVGHIAFSPATITSPDGDWTALALGPLAILPSHQRTGVGSALVRAGLAACLAMGHDLTFLLGHETYYPRFGFTPSKPKGVWWADRPDDSLHFMVVELHPNALAGRTGAMHFSPEYDDVS